MTKKVSLMPERILPIDNKVAAYGWPADLSDDEILERLFKLNQERAAKQ